MINKTNIEKQKNGKAISVEHKESKILHNNRITTQQNNFTFNCHKFSPKQQKNQNNFHFNIEIYPISITCWCFYIYFRIYIKLVFNYKRGRGLILFLLWDLFHFQFEFKFEQFCINQTTALLWHRTILAMQ